MNEFELSEFAYNTLQLTIVMLKFTALIMAIPTIAFLIMTIADYRYAKQNRQKMRSRNWIGLVILSSVLVFSLFVYLPMNEKELLRIDNELAKKAEFGKKLEITDEDYLFLVHALILNDSSMIGKDQAAAISKALHDGMISVDEFTQLPNIEMVITDETAKKINLNLSSIEQAKPMLIEMTKAYQKTAELSK